MRQTLFAAAMAAAVPLFIASGAQAMPMLEITMQSGGETKSESATFGAAGGAKTFLPVTVGNFSAANIGTELRSPGYIDLATIDLSSKAGGTLTITMTGTGFTSPVGASNWLTRFTGSVVNGAAEVSAKSYLDNSNTLYNPGCASNCSLLSSVSLNKSATGTATTDGLFALTEVITVTTTRPRLFGLDASVSSAGPAHDVPEPMSLALLGTGLAGFGLLRRRVSRQAI